MSEATLMLLEDAKASGKLLLVHVNGKFYMWKPPGFKKSLVPVQAPGPGSGAARPPVSVRCCSAAMRGQSSSSSEICTRCHDVCMRRQTHNPEHSPLVEHGWLLGGLSPVHVCCARDPY